MPIQSVTLNLALALGISLSLMTLLWWHHLRIRDAGVVDVGWSMALALLSILYACTAQGYWMRKVLIALMVSVWGFRLAIYLIRRIAGKPEDTRYTRLREDWGEAWRWKIFFFFQFQGVLAGGLSIPFLLISRNTHPELLPVEWIAAALWCIALAGEWIADRQLARFKHYPENRGRVCKIGLWNYSRHPNYFFEWLIWVSYAVMALASPYGWIGLYAPALMLYFLFRVTGIPATEQQAVRSKGDAYREYQQTTSAFVPWPRYVR